MDRWRPGSNSISTNIELLDAFLVFSVVEIADDDVIEVGDSSSVFLLFD